MRIDMLESTLQIKSMGSESTTLAMGNVLKDHGMKAEKRETQNVEAKFEDSGMRAARDVQKFNNILIKIQSVSQRNGVRGVVLKSIKLQSLSQGEVTITIRVISTDIELIPNDPPNCNSYIEGVVVCLTLRKTVPLLNYVQVCVV